GHSRQHASLESLRAGTANGLVGRIHEDPRVPVERDAHVPSAAYERQDLLDHRRICEPTIFARLIQEVHRTRTRVRLANPTRRDRISDEVQDFVRTLDGEPNLGCHVGRNLDSDADHCQLSVTHGSDALATTCEIMNTAFVVSAFSASKTF